MQNAVASLTDLELGFRLVAEKHSRSGYSDDVDQVFRSHGDQDSEAMPITDSGAWRSDRSEATLGFCIQHCTTLIQVVKQGNSKGKQSS
jgi:hypothetical protein